MEDCVRSQKKSVSGTDERLRLCLKAMLIIKTLLRYLVTKMILGVRWGRPARPGDQLAREIRYLLFYHF